jgi:hypothetical protein
VKVVDIRLNTFVPDVRLEKEPTSLSRNCYDVILTGWDRLETPPRQEQKNGYQIRRIRFKAHPGFFVREKYCTLALCNRTRFKELKK